MLKMEKICEPNSWRKTLTWSKYAYIDDLVTNCEFRSRGMGRFLINGFKSYAIENGCEQIHLDLSVQRFSVHKFYFRESFKIASHHFSIGCLSNNR